MHNPFTAPPSGLFKIFMFGPGSSWLLETVRPPSFLAMSKHPSDPNPTLWVVTGPKLYISPVTNAKVSF